MGDNRILKIAKKIMDWELTNISTNPEGEWMVWSVDTGAGLMTKAYLSWDPFTFLLNAFEVVDKMIVDGWEFELEYANFNEVPGERLEYEWWCSFNYYTDDAGDHKVASAKGKDAADAIANAALKVVEKYGTSVGG